MYSNAGIRLHKNSTLPNNRHVPTASDPPHATNNPFSSVSSLSIFGGHATRRSEDGILSSATLPRSASTPANRSTGRTTTTILAPPSSFHAHSKTSTSVSSFSRNPSHAAPSSSTSSVTTYSINHRARSSSTTSSFLSRTVLSKPAVQSTPSVSRSSPILRRNGSNGSGMAPVEPAAPQRINMRRLMSKPTAILVPDRAQSVMSFAQPPPSDTDDSQSIEDHLAIKSHSLDILRRSKRRSRSVDLMRNHGGPPPHPPTSPEGPLRGTTTSTGSSSTFLEGPLSAGEGRARGLTRSPRTPNTARPAPILLPDYNGVGPQPLNSDEDVDSPGFPLSPASIIALAWTESQKRANPTNPIASRRESSPSSTILQSGFAALDRLDSALVSSPIVFADADADEVSDQIGPSSPPIIIDSPEEREEAQEDDYFTPWAFAQQGLSPHSQRDISSPSMKGRHDSSKVGVAATMREVSRRFTGVLGRRERKQEKPAFSRIPINNPPSSFSMASFPPKWESNSSAPSSFSANLVSKAPKSHERAHSLALSRIAGAVKTEPLSNNQLLQTTNPPLVAYRQHSKPFTTEFSQLDHTHLSSDTDTSPPAKRDRSLEVATPRQLPPQVMPNWPLLHSASTRRATVDENGQDLTLSRQTSSQFASSPVSPTHPDRGQIPTPARNNTPNTLKKRSRPNLRAKSVPSAFVPVSNIATEGTETTGAHSTSGLSSDPPSLALNEGTVTGGKLRELVKKLSSGALGRNSSQSDRCRSSHTSTGARGNSSPISREIHSASADDVPPVPQIPKDFELILDADAYFAERARVRGDDRFDSDGESIPSGQGSGGPNTILRIPGSSQMSSSHSSMLGHKEQILADVSSLSSSLKSRLHVDTELDRAASSSKQPPVSAPVRRKQPPSVHSAYTFPRRANTTMEHSSSSNPQVDYIGLGYRSSSPSHSSTDLHAVNRLYSAAVTTIASGSFEEKKSVSSHSHEMVSSYPNSILAQPIMPPKDLYQHGEDEAATLRCQQNKESANCPERRKKPGGAVPASRNQEQSPATPPPPKLSPLMLPLTAPPPRPPRRVTRVRSSTVLDDSAPRQTHRHQRSLSSPISPTIPIFLTTKIANSTPLSKRSRSVGGGPRSPQPSTSTEALPSSSSSTTTQVKRARSTSLGKRAKHLPHLVVRPRRSESASNVSPNPPSGERSAGESGSQPKMRVKTSSGTIIRAKSVVTPKSASSPKSALHTPSSSASYTLSPQSSGHRSSSRTSRDHSFGHGWVTVDDGEAPPVPFTSTAFTFKEISPVTGPSPAKGKALTERDREDMWNALLSRSDRVGGTLTITMDQTEGAALLSDNASFRED